MNETLHEVYVGVGSNIGSRISYLHMALAGLSNIGSVRCSPIYETSPVGGVPQSDFLNMVIHLQTTLSVREVLATLQGIEQEAKRERKVRFGPRTLDLDVLLYDDDYICYRDLQVPHVRMWSRSFVVVPLADLAPKRRGLGGKTLDQLATELRQKDEVHYVGSLW